MNLVSIHIGPQSLPDHRAAFVRHNAALPGVSSFRFISDRWAGDLWLRSPADMQWVDAAGIWAETQRDLSAIAPADWLAAYAARGVRFQSDLMRIWAALTWRDILYIDTDIRLYRLPDIDPGAPYFGERNTAGHGGIYLFHSNACPDFFEELLRRLAKCPPRAPMPTFMLSDPALRRGYRVIPQTVYDRLDSRGF